MGYGTAVGFVCLRARHWLKLPEYIPQLLIFGDNALIAAGQMRISIVKFSANTGIKNACATSGVNTPTIAVSCQRIHTVPANRVAAYTANRSRVHFNFPSVALLGIRIQFNAYITNTVVASIQANAPNPSTKNPPITAPIMLPTSPLHPNQMGKIPSKIIGRYRKVKLGTATSPDR